MPPPANTASSQAASESQAQHQQELKARNAAGKQARESPQAEYQRPHRVHTSAERRAAFARKHAEELAEEARRHAHVDQERVSVLAQQKIEENQRIKGINWDEERKKKGRHPQQEQDEAEDDRAEEAAAKSLGNDGATGKYFQDMPDDRLGDLSLINPNEMKRLLGPSVRFAQHAMLLAEARMKEGMPRGEAIQFLASLYLGVTDRQYAQKALREFGPATGIVDLYPLEVVQHLLQNVPSFLSRVSTARFLASVPTEGHQTEVGKPVVLKYDAGLRIRGFAIKGGEKPGYILEPVEPPGHYHLTFATPGTFIVLLSALSKDGTLFIEEFAVAVAAGQDDAASLIENSAAMQRTRAAVSDPDAAPAEAAAAAPEAPEGAAGERPSKPPKDLKITIPRRI